MSAALRLILASAFAWLGAVLPNNGSGPSLAALPRLELVGSFPLGADSSPPGDSCPRHTLVITHANFKQGL